MEKSHPLSSGQGAFLAKLGDALAETTLRLQGKRYFQALREGMVLAIPPVMAGVFAILLTWFPVPAYQAFIKGFAGGLLPWLFKLLSASTVDIYVLILIVTISRSYGRLLHVRSPDVLTILCVCAQVAAAAGADGSFSLELFGKTRLLEGIVLVFLVSKAYAWLTGFRFFSVKGWTEGADALFNAAMSAILPFALILGAIVGLRALLWRLAGISDLNAVLTGLLERAFSGRERSLGGMLQFVFLVHLSWSFGIHGSNLLEGVARRILVPGVAVNQALIAAGGAPTETYSKAFLDAFVLMGGSGTVLCLVLAILIFERRRNVRSLAAISAPQVLFNINELVVFGLPIVFNPVMVLPFILTPLAMTLSSACATALGWVPLVVQHVEWTTPVFLSGWVATGSVAGSLLQLFNLILGTAIYAPFVILSRRLYEMGVKRDIEEATASVRKAEAEGRAPLLTSLPGAQGAVCRMLSGELESAIRAGRLELFYQPQVALSGEVTGMEALLRWPYKDMGYLYPPLVVSLATESGLLDELSDFITERALCDMERMDRELKKPLFISVNYAAEQLSDPGLPARVATIAARHGLGKMRLGVEITEQSLLSSSECVSSVLSGLKEAGFAIIMDDFGMGHSSASYLRNNDFDEVKIDGALVRPMRDNPRCREIIASIVYLSQSLGFRLIAEYVETEEQRDLLHGLGCDEYQGWLYSPAVSLEEAIAFVRAREGA